MDSARLRKFNKTYVWFAGLSGDLLFWVAIDTLFLTIVKGFNPSQIIFSTTLSLIIIIIFQIPILKTIKTIGNTNSVRLGSFFMLLSSILLTFGNGFLSVVFGKTFLEFGKTFLNISNIILKNNLDLQSRSDDYIKFRTKANTVYSTTTMMISFVASIMFNINNYLPMYGCVLFCIICFVLSFNIADYSEFNKIKKTSSVSQKAKINLSGFLIIVIVSYGLFVPIANSGQSNGKLFIQQELLLNFDVEKTSLILGAILCISRIVRVFSNILFNKIYKKLRDKVCGLLAIMLLFSILFMVLGFYIKNNLILKFLIMSIGYIIILFIRDPFVAYMQNLVLSNSNNENQQFLLTKMNLARMIMRAIMSLAFSMVLVKCPLITVISILLILAILETFVSIRIYRMILFNETKV